MQKSILNIIQIILIAKAANTLKKYNIRAKETVPIAIRKFLLLYPIFCIYCETRGKAY
jgi:hypothetical protein